MNVPQENLFRNVAASERNRFKKITGTAEKDFNTLLTRYAIERLLYRLSESKHRHRFVLKSAIHFALWHETPHRVTRNFDLLGFGESSLEELKRCSVKSACKRCQAWEPFSPSNNTNDPDSLNQFDVSFGVAV